MEALSPAQRTELIDTMFRHVASTLASSRSICAVSVLTGENTLIPQGCKRLFDHHFELNTAVTCAARELRELGETGMLLVVHADLPFVTGEDIDALAAACEPGAVVAAPDWTGNGTNALAYPLGCKVITHFGRNSLRAHREAAMAAGLSFALVNRVGLAQDIDEPAQLNGLCERGGERYAFLARTVHRGRPKKGE